MTSRKTTIAMFVAIAVAGSVFVSFPAGIARAYPVQHAVNVLAAVMLGYLAQLFLLHSYWACPSNNRHWFLTRLSR